MKKNYTLFLFLFSMLFALQTNAQSLRMVFIEEATQASCPPCASLNPALQAKVNANPDNVVFLGYQVWWPGFDPMYEDNSGEVDERVGNYYDFAFAPQIKVQGSFIGDGSLGLFNQTHIDAIKADTAEFDITLNAEIVNGSLEITGSVDGTDDVSGDLRLRLAIIEHIIHKTDAPGGTNTETEYHNVFKKFIGGTDGITLADTWAAGDSYAIDESFDLSTLNVYNYAEIQVIAIVQNDDNKFVHQAAIAKDVPITVEFDNNSGALGIVNLPPSVCVGDQTLTPSVQIQNNGNVELTSVDVIYNINGGADQTYNWTGSVATLAKTTITLDPYSFVAQADNTINVTLANPNGMTDEETSDNSATASLGQAPEGATEYTITLNFDCWPQENSWDLKNSAGTIVASHGVYAAGQAQTQVIEAVDLVPNDCYTFTFKDTYGDGMHGSQWNSCTVDGNITIKDQFDNEVYNYDGSYDTANEPGGFSSTFVSAVDEAGLKDQVDMNPNPTSGILHVNLTGITGETQAQVFTLDGKMVQSQIMDSRSFQLDLSSYNNGIYLVRLVNGEKAITQRVTVQK